VKNSVLLIFGLLAFLFLVTHAQAAPWEVLSDVRFIKKGGVKAVRIDFALPVHYESHFPASRGKVITINVRFNLSKDEDISQLPLLQTLLGPDSESIPLEDVTYVTERGVPKLILRFKEPVNFSVSQVMGISNLVIFLPEKVRIKESDPVVDPIIQEFIPLSEGTADESLARKMVDDGRKALKDGDNLRAIQIFSKLMSMPQHTYQPISLEMLGVARERNNQVAQAKAVYENYLEKYPKSEDLVRVKQRMADLVASQMRPKKRLKQSKTSKRAKKGYDSQFNGYFSQYFSFYQTRQESEGTTTVDYQYLSNALSLDWRVRSGDNDVRSRFDVNYDYDFAKEDHDEATDGLEVSYAYTKLKNSRKGIFATVGRHSANTAGGFGRVDGISYGQNITSKIRADIVGGYVVDSSDKTHVQTNQPLIGVGMEYNKIWRSLNMAPFFKMQKYDGYLESQSVGTDFSFFDKKTNIFGLVEYDTSYNGLNIFMTRAAYNINKNISVTGRLDYRASPLYGTSNALNCDERHSDDAETLGEYIDVLADVAAGPPPLENDPNDPDGRKIWDEINALGPEEYARQQAAACTGDSSTVEVGTKLKFSAKRDLNLTVSASEYNRSFKEVEEDLNAPEDQEPVYIIGDTVERQYNFYAQFITRSSFMKRDTILVDGRYTYSNTTPSEPNAEDERMDNIAVSANYRTVYDKDWRFNARLRVRYKTEDVSGDVDKRDTTIVEPSLKMQYRGIKKFNIYTEFGISSYYFSGAGVLDDTQDFTQQYFNAGFDWNF